MNTDCNPAKKLVFFKKSRNPLSESVSVRVSLEEKEMRVFVRATRSHSHSHSFSVPGAGLEPAQPLWSQDFKSCVSTIPPSGQT
jgi:hypothetical protein